MFGVGVIVIILAVVVSIFLHELGHYLAAKRAGMKVTEFFIGFGPRIWSFRRGETEYGVKAIWAGAYVKIIGMNNLEEVRAADEAHTYRRQLVPQTGGHRVRRARDEPRCWPSCCSSGWRCRGGYPPTRPWPRVGTVPRRSAAQAAASRPATSSSASGASRSDSFDAFRQA